MFKTRMSYSLRMTNVRQNLRLKKQNYKIIQKKTVLKQ